ncbi:hypothetical protein [Muricomes intestini]|jgi:hypothetical protein|uniref:hypothetical protein n=1 Tax=Muricomes intestini TaxID=1796634 RepID=UPI002FE05048
MIKKGAVPFFMTLYYSLAIFGSRKVKIEVKVIGLDKPAMSIMAQERMELLLQCRYIQLPR